MDIFHVWGRDVAFAPRRDLSTASGAIEAEQRLYRRLMTNLLGYVWSPGYGAGLPAFVGQPVHADTAKAVIVEQCSLEPGISSPVVTLEPQGTDTLLVSIAYVYAPTGQAGSLNFGLGG